MSDRVKGTPQRLKKKNCAFPGCNVEFIGRGKAKYCEEHRKAKYRKELYKKNDNDGEAIVIIEHDEIFTKKVIRECGLRGCTNEYTITLIPNLYEYPNYCEQHRNQYQRELFLDKQENSNND